jgi:hypothetical protein
MAVSLNSAKGALNSFTGTDLFKQAMYHDKAHFDKAQAKQSITDGKRTTCGVYYKKAKKTVWVNNEDSSLVRTSLKKGQKKSKWHQVKTDVRQKVDVNSGFEIINAALKKSEDKSVKFKDLGDGSKFLFAVPSAASHIRPTRSPIAATSRSSWTPAMAPMQPCARTTPLRPTTWITRPTSRSHATGRPVQGRA